MKKGQSISINTIVVAIIALLVLIVVIFVFSKQISDWFVTTNTCETAGGLCLESTGTDPTLDSDDTCPDRYAQVPGASCDKGKCCREIIPEVPTTT